MINHTANNKNKDDGGEEEDVPILPGFRFHPTDEELVGFYLLKKVKWKLMGSIDYLIREVDIYRYDPWDLPKLGSEIGEKEWYFFCMRGRKYRNSKRPNRVSLTGSGFWKATGIDKPIYSCKGKHNLCIGLKKSLTYYHRGNAGKGTKTEWMMHEFRLPDHDNSDVMIISDEKEQAGVWTLCRILKRDVAPRQKHSPILKHIIHNKTMLTKSTSEIFHLKNFSEGKQQRDASSREDDHVSSSLHEIQKRSFYSISEGISITRTPFVSSISSLSNEQHCEDQLIRNWDELGSVMICDYGWL